MTLRLLFVLTTLMCVQVPATLFAVDVHVVINGIDDAAGTTVLRVSNGVTAFNFTRSGSDRVTGPGPEVLIGYDEDGSPIWDTSAVFTEEWTWYTFQLPQEWIGKGICCSLDGVRWSPYTLLAPGESNYQEVPLTHSQVVGSDSWTFPDPQRFTSEQGNHARVGRWWSDATQPLFIVNSWDNANPYWPSVGMDFSASAPNAYYRWFHPIPDTSDTALAMELDHMHRLLLRGRSHSGNTISLDPDSSSIAINGSPVLTASKAAPTLASTFVTTAELEGRSFLAHNRGRVALGAGAAVRAMQPAGSETGQIVIGRYNDMTRTDGVLIVGTGGLAPNGTISRSNGLRILDDGTVLIRPKGGLEMAPEFSQGLQP